MSKPLILFTVLVVGIIGAVQTSQAHVRIPPRYPQDAAEECIEGHVIFQFVINDQGLPKEFEILESLPLGIFDSAVRRAVNQWRYDPERAGEKILEILEFRIYEDCEHLATHNKPLKFVPAFGLHRTR